MREPLHDIQNTDKDHIPPLQHSHINNSSNNPFMLNYAHPHNIRYKPQKPETHKGDAYESSIQHCCSSPCVANQIKEDDLTVYVKSKTLQKNFQDIEIDVIYSSLPIKVSNSIRLMVKLKDLLGNVIASPCKKRMPIYHKKCIYLELDGSIVDCIQLKKCHNAKKIALPYKAIYNYVIVKRPHLDMFLEEVGKYYDIFVFTRMLSSNAKFVVNYINEKKEYIKGIYSKEDCVLANGIYVKNLDKCSRKIEDVILIDHKIESFSLHCSNGVYISEFKYNKVDDDELCLLKQFLIESKESIDSRNAIESKFYLSALISHIREYKRATPL